MVILIPFGNLEFIPEDSKY